MFEMIIKWRRRILHCILALLIFLALPLYVFHDWLANLFYILWEWLNATQIWDWDEVTKESEFSETDIAKLETAAVISRNRGWFILGVVTSTVALFTIVLTFVGRIIAHKSNVQEHKKNIHNRYEKAANMLANEAISDRVAGCRALTQIAKDDKDMWPLCTRLLLGYIKNPHLSTAEKIKLSQELNRPVTRESVEEFTYIPDELIKIFPSGASSELESNKDNDEEHESENDFTVLRTDIQEAAISISAIYQHVYDKRERLNDKIIQLPSYFWQNGPKERLYLAGANLSGTILREAELSWVNFKKANLSSAKLQKAELSYTNFQKADLSDANLRGAIFSKANLKAAKLSGADITGAYLREVEGLTMRQVLSAKWGVDENGKGEIPILPDKLKKNKQVEKWCMKPNYGIKGEQPIERKASGITEIDKKLPEYMQLKDKELYKVHCGIRNTSNPITEDPLEVFVDGRWDTWQEPWGGIERFNREYIFTMIKFSKRDIWLFGGVYQVINRRGLGDYDIELTNQWEEHIGKLKLKLKLRGRNHYRKFETIYDKIEHAGELDKRYGSL